LSLDSKWVVSNPEALGQAERELWNKIESVLDAVLEELKANGKIETVFTHRDIDLLVDSLKKSDDLGQAYNALLRVLENEDQTKEFLEVNKPFELDWSKLFSLYLASGVELVIQLVEQFKLLLLFVPEGVSYEVSKFNTTIAESAPQNWPELKNFVDSEFRNALAHGTYAIVNKKIVLFKNAKFEVLEVIQLSDFMIRMKKENVLAKCLLGLITSKIRSGFFLP
jgi:hypothetical protein